MFPPVAFVAGFFVGLDPGTIDLGKAATSNINKECVSVMVSISPPVGLVAPTSNVNSLRAGARCCPLMAILCSDNHVDSAVNTYRQLTG